MKLIERYQAEGRLIAEWHDKVFPQAARDAGLALKPAVLPAEITTIPKDERWWQVDQAGSVKASLCLYLNTNRCNVVITVGPEVAEDFLGRRVEKTTVGARRLGWTFHFVSARQLVCFFEDLNIAAPDGLNSGWIARDLTRMLKWLLTREVAF